MNTYHDSEKPCEPYKYTLIIDDNTYKYNIKKNLIKKIEQDFNITGVKHWIANFKVPKIYHHKFNYVEFNGNIIHDIKNKKYKFNITIDDKVYSDDLRKNVIKRVEKEFGIQGVKKWYEHNEIPLKYQDRFNVVKLNDIEIYNKDNRKYRISIKIDGVEYTSNSKLKLINELQINHNIKNVALWFEHLRLLKSDTEKYREVIINGKTIHPRKKRGFL